jgi:hypothetical protein
LSKVTKESVVDELSQIRSSRSPLNTDKKSDASLVFIAREAFREILAIEGSLEQAKKELALKHDFTLGGAF